MNSMQLTEIVPHF